MIWFCGIFLNVIQRLLTGLLLLQKWICEFVSTGRDRRDGTSLNLLTPYTHPYVVLSARAEQEDAPIEQYLVEQYFERPAEP